MAMILSVGSGKGGVGKSVLVGNLGLLLARHGFRVVLADFDVGGADLHILFGLFDLPATLTDFVQHRVSSLETVALPVPGQPHLRLIPGTGETLATATLPAARKQRLIRRLRELDADVILVDVGAGTSPHTLDSFLMADLPLVVTTPEPTAVLDAYRFLKLATLRRVLSGFLARGAVAAAIADREFVSVDAILDAVGAAEASGRAVAHQLLATFRPALVVNQVTGRARVNILQLQRLLRDYVGGTVTCLGEVPADDAVPRAVRQYLPVVEAFPTAPAVQALDRIATVLVQAIHAHGASRSAAPPAATVPPRSLRPPSETAPRPCGA
ncbi:P-loop NTPase [Nitrospira sp. Kam-Ns4a]